MFYEPERMVLETVPIPGAGANDLLVKVEAVGICGSDVSYYFGHSPLGTPDGRGPLVLGHEISGVVAEAGENAKRQFSVGDRVTLNPVQQCNACPECLDGRFNLCRFVETLGVSVDGGFAEYVRVRYTHALKIEPSVAFESAALTEPLACATYAMRKLNVRLGDYAVVIGSGSIGLMMLQIAKARGAGRLAFIGTRDAPLELGLEMGADAVANVKHANSAHYAPDVVEWIRETGGGKLADRVVVPTSDIQALHWALYGSGPGATIAYFGLPGPDDRIQVPALDTIQADKTITFAWLSPLVWPEATAALASGKVDVSRLVSHRYSFENVEKGIRELAAGDPKKIKGLVAMG
jgi:L-iditol 2-dehydrogenase